MKKSIIIAMVLLVNSAFAQKTYKTEFENSANAVIDISLSAGKITLIGHDKNEIIIEGTGTVSQEEAKNEYLESYQNEAIKEAENDKRAEGLKPLTPSLSDNTGLGIMVEKKGGHISISSQPFVSSEQYKIMVPNKAKLVINDVHHFEESKYNYVISNMTNEVIVTSINSNFLIEKITGPLVLNTTNGDVEVKYDELTTTKPISIVTVNGFVDLTLPANVKADFQLQTIQGKAFTDFEILRDEKETSMMHPYVDMFLLSGKVNGGGTRININSVNGDIYLRKKKG